MNILNKVNLRLAPGSQSTERKEYFSVLQKFFVKIFMKLPAKRLHITNCALMYNIHFNQTPSSYAMNFTLSYQHFQVLNTLLLHLLLWYMFVLNLFYFHYSFKLWKSHTDLIQIGHVTYKNIKSTSCFTIDNKDVRHTHVHTCVIVIFDDDTMCCVCSKEKITTTRWSRVEKE